MNVREELSLTVNALPHATRGFEVDRFAREGVALPRAIETGLPGFVEAALGRSDPKLYRTVLAIIERPLLELALDLTCHNQLKAAKLLGINRNTLRKRLRLLGIAPRGKKGASR